MSVKLKYCFTCLSDNRCLISTFKYSTILKEINLQELKGANGGICWECQGIILKFYKFKLRIHEAQRLMSQKVEPIQSLSKLIHQTKISYDNKYLYNPDPLVNNEILNTEIKEIKAERAISDEDYDNSDKDCKESIEDIYVGNIDVKRVEVNKEVKVSMRDNDKKIKILRKKILKCKNPKLNNKKHNLKEISLNKKRIKKEKQKVKIIKDDQNKREISQKEFEEKFERVIFSEEEMLKNREDKRNHPNFKKILFNCNTCILGFIRKENYDLHLVKKHDENIGPYQCPVCQIRFVNQRSKERHKIKHYSIYRCKLCRYETVELWSAFNHCGAKHSEDSAGRIHCPQCIVVVKTPEELAEHTRTEHILYCHECGEKFRWKSTLRAHLVRIHSVKREFSCDLCRKSFKSKSRLESHTFGHSTAATRRLAYCADCDIQYKNLNVYRSHLRNSANHSERFPCPECNKKFASKVYWTKHYNFYHLHKSQYKCEVCNKLFISHWRLKNHKQKYHGLSRTRDHSCNVCGKEFFTMSALRGHMLIHSDQRSYMCEDCGDTFKQRPALYTHTRLVHRGGRKNGKKDLLPTE